MSEAPVGVPEAPELVEVRCPVGPRRLFTKLRLQAGAVRYVQPENWIEMSCADCRGQLRRQAHVVTHVLHRYDFTGALVETVLVYADDRQDVLPASGGAGTAEGPRVPAG